MKTLRLILFLMLAVTAFAGEVWVSVPPIVNQSRAAFSFTSSTFPTYYTTCDSNFLFIHSITGVATTTGVIAPCRKTSVKGLCTTTGDVGSSEALSVTTNQIFTLGWENGSYKKGEATTGTYFTGSFIFERNCITTDFLR